MSEPQKVALIVGAGAGLSGSLTRKLAASGYRVALAARDTGKPAGLIRESGAAALACDASSPEDVARLFNDGAGRLAAPDVAIYTDPMKYAAPHAAMASR